FSSFTHTSPHISHYFFSQSHCDHPALHSFPTHALPISVSFDYVLQENESGEIAISGDNANWLDVTSDFGLVKRFSNDVTWPATADRKSTRLNSSHDQISYAVFCLKKKTKHKVAIQPRII